MAYPGRPTCSSGPESSRPLVNNVIVVRPIVRLQLNLGGLGSGSNCQPCDRVLQVFEAPFDA